MADGQPLRLGEVNDATSMTSLQRDNPPFPFPPADGRVFNVRNSSGGGLLVQSISGSFFNSERGIGIDVVVESGFGLAVTSGDSDAIRASGSVGVRADGNPAGIFAGDLIVRFGSLVVENPPARTTLVNNGDVQVDGGGG